MKKSTDLFFRQTIEEIVPVDNERIRGMASNAFSRLIVT